MSPVAWLEQGAGDVPAGSDWLSPGEREREACLRFPKRRLDWRLGRWTAKRALALRQGGVPEDYEVRVSPEGAPVAWRAGAPLPVVLSISHSDGRAVAALGQAEVLGCDLESIEPRPLAFVEDYLAPAERALVAHAAPDDATLLVTLFWSGKESLMKALRAGLRIAPAAIEVSMSGGLGTSEGEWRPLSARFGSSAYPGFWRRDGRRVLTLVAQPPPHPPRALG